MMGMSLFDLTLYCNGMCHNFSVLDPFHLGGSGSTSRLHDMDSDMDPGSKKSREIHKK